MFLHMSVSHCVHMGGMHGPGDVPGGGVGNMHARGTCVARGHAWPGAYMAVGACMAGEWGLHGWGLHDWGGAWPGGCVPCMPPGLILRDTVSQ